MREKLSDCLTCGNETYADGVHLCPNYKYGTTGTFKTSHTPIVFKADEITFESTDGTVYAHWGVSNQIKGEDMLDRDILCKLDGYREARDAAVRKAQALKDEATLMRHEADKLDSNSDFMIDEINEQVPVEPDPSRG